jgi:ribosome biogenesis protein ERB1
MSDSKRKEISRPDSPDLLPEIIPDYLSDSSDDETENTIGNVPIEWYDDFDHIGYDINGTKIQRPVGKDQLDSFLAEMDDPSSWYPKLQFNILF